MDRNARTGTNGHTARDQDNRSIGQVLQDITQDLRELVREEITLAKTEINQALKKIVAGAVLLVIGAVLANTGLNALVASAVLGLATTWTPWLAALVVGLAIILIGGGLAYAGIRSVQEAELKPERTLRTLKEDAQAVKEEMR